MNTTIKVFPAPRHFWSSHCNACSIDSQLFVNPAPAIQAGRRHICKNKKITIFHHINYYSDTAPVKEIWGAVI